MKPFGLALWLAGIAVAGQHGEVRRLVDAAPGCAAGVLRAGRVEFAGAAGSGLSASTPFYLASVSKQFTAAAVYRLAEMGKVRLNEPIVVRIPELGVGAAGATVQQLLHHTSGLRDYGALQELAGSRENLDNLDVVRLLAKQRGLNFVPGTNYAYSNSEYALLGLLVERASGVPFREFVRREFGILGTDGGAAVPRTMGDGGLYGSVEELLGWMRRIERPDSPAIRRIQVRARIASGERLPHASGLFWGRYGGRTTLSHDGMAAEFSAELLHFPKERLSVVCLCRQKEVSAPALARKIADVYLGSRGKPVAQLEADGLEGMWLSRQGFVMQVRRQGAGLVALLGGEEYLLPGNLVLRRRGRDRVQAGWEGDRPTEFRRMKGRELQNAGPSGYLGHFSNDEVSARWTLLAVDGHLVLTTEAGWRIPLDAIARDRFGVGPWLLEFDADGSGFRLHRERLWSLAFRRE